MNPISAVLTLCKFGVISESDVAAWANREVARVDIPTPELIDLVCDGPVRCSRRTEWDYSFRPVDLEYLDECSLRAFALDLDATNQVRRFVNWAARASMAEDLDYELVKFGYQLDHLISDCNDEAAAIAYAKAKLPSLKMHFAPTALALLEAVPDVVQSAFGSR